MEGYSRTDGNVTEMKELLEDDIGYIAKIDTMEDPLCTIKAIYLLINLLIVLKIRLYKLRAAM